MIVKGRLLLLVVALLAVAAPSGAATGEHKVVEHVDLTLVKRTGSGTKNFQHKGRATGTVNGTVTSRTTLTHSVLLRGTVTIVTREGRIQMKVDGRARTIKSPSKFNGTATMTGGTGKYKGATGTGTFTGMVNRHTWHVTLDAKGSYHY